MSRAGTRATCLSAGSGVRLLECRVWSSPSRSACRASSGRVLPPPAPWIRTRVLPRTRPSCRSALECCLQRDPLAVDLLSPTKIGSRCYRQERSRRRAVEQGEPEGWRQDPRGGESAGERQGARLPRPPDRGDKRRPCGTTPRRPSRARRAPCTIAPARPGTTGSTAPPGTRPPLPERTHHSALARRDHHVLDVERGELAKPKRRCSAAMSRSPGPTDAPARPPAAARLLLRRQRARRCLRQRLALDVCRPQANEQGEVVHRRERQVHRHRLPPQIDLQMPA